MHINTCIYIYICIRFLPLLVLYYSFSSFSLSMFAPFLPELTKVSSNNLNDYSITGLPVNVVLRAGFTVYSSPSLVFNISFSFFLFCFHFFFRFNSLPSRFAYSFALRFFNRAFNTSLIIKEKVEDHIKTNHLCVELPRACRIASIIFWIFFFSSGIDAIYQE